MSTVIAAPISDELAQKTSELVTELRQSDKPRDHRKAAIALIDELTRAGLEGFFLQSSREIGLGSMVQGAIRLGLKTASRAISVLVRRFVSKFDDEQMGTTADILERIIIRRQGEA